MWRCPLSSAKTCPVRHSFIVKQSQPHLTLHLFRINKQSHYYITLAFFSHLPGLQQSDLTRYDLRFIPSTQGKGISLSSVIRKRRTFYCCLAGDSAIIRPSCFACEGKSTPHSEPPNKGGISPLFSETNDKQIKTAGSHSFSYQPTPPRSSSSPS